MDLDPYGGTNPLCMFPLFLKRTADVLAPRLSVVFRRLLRLGSFPACRETTNYQPIFITPVLSKVFERLVVVRLGRFMEHCGLLPTTQFAYRKGLGTCDELLCVYIHCRVH